MASPGKSDQTLQILQQAAQLHSAGRFAEAEPLYRKVLARSGDNFDAIHLLGVLLSQTRRFDQAETLLRRAVHLRPSVAEAQSNLGNLLRERDRPGEALPHLRRAVELNPKFPSAYQNLGVALNALKKATEAAECFHQALALNPSFPEALNSLGNSLREEEKLEESEACFRKAIALRTDYAEAHTGLGATLEKLHRNEESVASCRRAVAIRPDFAEGHNNLGMALLSRKAYQEAEAEVREALRLRPGYVDAMNNLGAVLAAVRRYEEAVASYRKAIKLEPENAELWTNLGSVLRNLRRFDEAKETCRHAIALKPESSQERYNLGVVHLDLCEIAEAIRSFRDAIAAEPQKPLPHWGLALTLLVNGEYLEGWEQYEWRWECSDFYPARPKFSQPAWDGTDPSGKTILICSEQGLGDAIQFVRYAPLLSEMGARGGRVIVQCQPSMKTLFATLSGIHSIHCPSEPLPDFDLYCSLLSLPRVLKTTVETIPANIPYLSPDPDRLSVWKKKLGPLPGKLKIGIAWAGNPDHQRDHDRSCGLAALAPLANVNGVTFISLQKGPAASQASHPPAGMELHDFTAELTDFEDTAALIANLDLVISVDTSVAHLTGALGKPVWTLLAFAPDWRWLLNRVDTPWYPTMRLFRQTTVGDWASAVNHAALALADLAGNA